jgi:hypothetical protein
MGSSARVELVSLTDAPLTRLLPEPGQPFVVYAIWVEDTAGRFHPPRPELGPPNPDAAVVKFAAANLPGGPLGEFAVSGSLADPISRVYREELPIALSLRLGQVDGHGVWLFDFLGQSSDFASIWRIPPEVQPNAPTSLLPEELNAGAEDQLRESLGLPPEAPIPEPAGQLPPDQAADEPYRFDPTPHLDLSSAEPAPALPEPKAPGPLPPSGAQHFFAPPLPEGQEKNHGAYGDASVPFAH